MAEPQTARALAEHRATRRAHLEPCSTPDCGRAGWYRYPPATGVPRCTTCGAVLRVTWAIAAEPVTAQAAGGDAR